MSAHPVKTLDSLPLNSVRITGGIWRERMNTNRRATLPYEYRCCEETGRFEALELKWKPGNPRRPHWFWDSDVAKWLEAVAYALQERHDPKIYKMGRRVADLIVSAQQPDGYIHSYFSQLDQEKKFTNLRDLHELYTAGHLIEAAVAWYEATGERDLLDALCRFADLIDRTFGPNPGQIRGYDGHQEIELALVRLYRVTSEKRYLDLARFFVDERGRSPCFFDAEAQARGEKPKYEHAYCQAHRPVRQQKTAEGHAVRAMYLYCAMADLAAETGDRALRKACRDLWDNVTQRRMYAHGGVGSSAQGERFTVDYDLPNEAAYAESCAAIGLVFWAERMLRMERDGRYADVLERALYNNVLASVSRSGAKFFYANPLAVSAHFRNGHGDHVRPTRQPWFWCACCPPNIARILASLPRYIYATEPQAVWVHLYMPSRAEFTCGGVPVSIEQRTEYPWAGRVRIDVEPQRSAKFSVALRIPGWCRDAKLTLNGKSHAFTIKNGYARLSRVWQAGDRLVLDLVMPVEKVHAHPLVTENAGRVALQRGPVLYCFEQCDNGPNLDHITLPECVLPKPARIQNMGGHIVLVAKALQGGCEAWNGALYAVRASRFRAKRVRAIPYGLWGNRKPGEMRVWIRERI
ncbi:MAG: glycoside hydrolase family 127 protein [Planctomycetes bacterium]|nr:glycoside hydrolase family 127 protein [Planctomycetota bacterium]